MAVYSVKESVKGGTFKRAGVQSAATRVFTVCRTDAGICTTEEAQFAVDAGTGLAIPTTNSSYSVSYPILQCGDINPRKLAPNFIEVTCNYSVGNFTDASLNPLLEPPKISWQ